ncbi:MAG: ThuA domain-containing protein [Chitinophagaceae bacterium]
MLAHILFKKIFLLLALAGGFMLRGHNNPADTVKAKKILVFAKTNGYHHESIAAGLVAIQKLGAANKFAVDTTTDSLMISDANLKQYKVIVFLSTTGKVLGAEQETALQNFMHKGGGFVGIHAAADCEYNWPWYNKLVGGWFKSHPKQQTAKLQIINKDHLSTKHLPDTWERWDEWYNYKDLNPDVTVLIKIDETSYTGGANDGNHPMAWYHNYEGGKAFYTALGHTNESFAEPAFLQHVLGGIQYAMGK